MALTTLGIRSLYVKKMPKIIFFGTGNEIVDFKKRKIYKWQVRNSNNHYFSLYGKNLHYEIINGGVVSPVGQDYKIDPVEIPPLRTMMKGDFKFVFGLANDEIGYIIPKSEWDEVPPYLYNHHDSPYGEVNSLGPEAGPIIHQSIRDILNE